MKKPSIAIAVMPKEQQDPNNPAPDMPGDESEPRGMDEGVGQLCLPQDVVATADDKDQKVAPEVGDEVRFDAVAKVTKVENGNVYLTPTEVNSESVGDQNDEDEESEPEQPNADTDESMLKLGQDADKGGY